ncbi:MAG: serpin family protein [Bacteroidales bacterium]|nr:serpin family protein [Bacteroidales bacterium]
MKKSRLIILAIICCLSVSCTKETPGDPSDDLHGGFIVPAPPPPIEEVEVDNYFALDLYTKIFQDHPHENLCVSPQSIYTFLAMLANGTGGETRDEVLNALRLEGYSTNMLNDWFTKLIRTLDDKDPGVKFEQSNSFWYQKEMMINSGFRQNLSEYYQADIFPVDFCDPQTLGLMNNWVDEKTHGLISEIVSVIPPGTVFNLTNAIYFNGKWTHVFNKKRTKYSSFRKLDRTYTTMEMMRLQESFRCLDHPSWFGVEIPYGNESWAMYAFLPKQLMELDKLTLWLRDNWSQIRTKFQTKTEQKLNFPRFELSNKFDIKPYLQSQGIAKAMTSSADFSPMTKTPVWLDWVIHKTVIKVTEDGTEAAAITSGGGTTGVGPYGLVFDHPFSYIIAEKSTGLILFIGQVMDPAVEE